MDALGSTGSKVTTIVVVILLVIALYYLYNFLYGTSGITKADIFNGPKLAMRQNKPATVTLPDALPALYEGGEYSVSFWMYINDYSYQRGHNKHVLTLGPSGTAATNFDTLRVYLGPNTSSLAVRIHTGTSDNNLLRSGNDTIFSDLSTGAASGPFPTCDLVSVDLQRWVNITIVINGRSSDVYMDGKLARSCILDSFFRVDPSGYQLTLLDKGGFGGYVSNTSAFGYALNPEQVYRMYMAGPGPQYDLLGWLKSLFDPKAVSSMEYPKMN